MYGKLKCTSDKDLLLENKITSENQFSVPRCWHTSDGNLKCCFLVETSRQRLIPSVNIAWLWHHHWSYHMLCTKHNDNHTDEKIYAIGDRHLTTQYLETQICGGKLQGEIELLQLDEIKDWRSLHTKITKEQRIMVELF